jgi:hypothetical protein
LGGDEVAAEVAAEKIENVITRCSLIAQVRV